MVAHLEITHEMTYKKRILIWYQPYSDLSCPKSNLTITQLDVDVKDLFQNENTVLLHVSSVQCPSEKQTKIKSNYSAHAQKKNNQTFLLALYHFGKHG